MNSSSPLRALAPLLSLALPALAVEVPTVARFPIVPSPIGLRGDARPRQYLGVVSPRAAWLGYETGAAELWVHPLKIAKDFRLDFRIPEYSEPVSGAEIARTVEVRPELTTLTYSHATFTVRQHILAPLDEPGLLVLLEVDAYRPLEIVVSFKSVLQYAWPGGLGGQYVAWNETENAFLLSESLRKHNAFLGSPWAKSGSGHPAHNLPDVPSSFSIPVNPERASKELIPIALSAGIAPREEVAAAYRRLLGSAPALYQQRRAHAERLLGETVSLETPDKKLDLAFAWAKVNLDEQTVCNPDLGCGLVAGWGPSGESLRPGFGWFFGGDAAINSLAMSLAGLNAGVEQGLRFLAKHQRADGKLPHEISQAAARIPWFTEFPYAYYHADTTPFWLVALHRHWRATGDATILRELWPAARKAWAWCLATDTDGDGLIENTSGGLGAIEVGAIGQDMHQDVYLASVWTRAAEAMAEMAGASGDSALANDAAVLHRKARAALNLRYWLPQAGHHAFGILRSGATNDTLTVWPATAAAFGLLETERAGRTLAQLASHEITADWGARMLSTASPLYDPTHYNMGAVWPFVTGFLAWGHYNYGRPWAGYPLIEGLRDLTFDFARGRHPELLSGAYYRPLDEAVPQQFFASSMLVTPVLAGLLGWDPDAPNARATLAPQLPPQWPRLAVRGLRVGLSRLDVTIEQQPGRLAFGLIGSGPAFELRVGEERVRLDGGRRRIAVPSRVKIAVEPPALTRAPGQMSRGLRVLLVRETPDGIEVEVEGPAGTSSPLGIWIAGRRTERKVDFPTAASLFSRAVVKVP